MDNDEIIRLAAIWGYKASKTRSENIKYLTERFKGSYTGSNNWDILSNKVQVNNSGYMTWPQFVDLIDSIINDTQITFW